MRYRTWPVLLIGLTTLLLLNALWGVTAIRKSKQIYREVLANQERYRENDKVLVEIRSGIFIVNILVRDFLLDTSPVTSEVYRKGMLDIRSSVERQVARLEQLTRPEDRPILKNLQAEMDAFWAMFNPVFEWTLDDKLENSRHFLRYQLRPRRNAVLSIAEQVSKLNAGNIAAENENTQRSKDKLFRDLRQMITASLLLGVLIVAGCILRVSQLERRTELQHRKTEEAEQALRLLSHRLVKAQEEERRSLSRELHDEVGQILTALRMEVGSLEQLRTENGQAFQEHVEDAKQLAEQSLRAVRDMAMGLRPSMLDDLGLGPAVEWQARDFARRVGVPVSVEIDGDLKQISDAQRTCVYRVVQEALTNCARHAQAKNIRITLHGSEESLTLSVEDDGIGMASEIPERAGIGLVGIEERVRELGGTIHIQSQPARGTMLRIKIPLNAEVAV
ncbi:MAG TPA: ATP-binding protein [Bryobacteraceae bacterium]|nr:ATP-binding protein [Bryobacteraceae bacterium]